MQLTRIEKVVSHFPVVVAAKHGIGYVRCDWVVQGTVQHKEKYYY
jgi:hypothetical protein